MQENEEAQRSAEDAERRKLREQEAALERENELNMLDFEREQQHLGPVAMDINGPSGMQGDGDDTQGGISRPSDTARKHEVLSH
jgi:[histone H3]-lysine36 N-trimethyltransferase